MGEIMTVEKFIKNLDFKENDYFYHVTGSGNGESIFKDGLYIDGNNILNAKNLLETTTIPLTEDMVLTSHQFKEFLEDETKNSRFRDTSEMVVIGAPKKEKKNIVSKFDNFVDGKYYEGIISNDYIMGYFSNEKSEFVENENYNYLFDYYDDSTLFK